MPNFKDILRFLYDFLETIAVSAAIYFFLITFIFQPHEVNGQSMYPTLHHNDRLLTSKLHYRFSEPNYGDIVVFKAPYHEEYDYIKRLIGKPGDKIKINGGRVYRNGELLDESSFLDKKVQTLGERFLIDGEEVTVPAQTYFVMGDNRSNSSDSRDFGPVPFKNMVGKAWIRYWPLNNMGVVKHGS